MSINFADLIVLGPDITGVVAGSLLAKRGMNVLAADRPSSRLTLSLPGLESRIFKSIVGKLSLTKTQLSFIEPNPISFQIILPEHRFNVLPDNEALLEEFAREFPDHASWAQRFFTQVEQFYSEQVPAILQQLPYQGWWQQRSLRKLRGRFQWPDWPAQLQQLPINLQAFFKAWLLFLSDNPIMLADSLQALNLFSQEQRSTSTVHGGWQALKNLFLEKIEYFGGAVLNETPFEYHLSREGAALKSVHFQGYHFSTACRYLLCNEALVNYAKHLPGGFRFRHYKRSLQRKPAIVAFTMQLLCARRILPEPMAQNVLMIEDVNAPLVGTNYFQFQVIPLAETLSSGDDTILQVRYFLAPDMIPADKQERLDSFERWHESITSRIKKLIPFHEGRIRRLHPLISTEAEHIFSSPTESYARFFADAEAIFPPALNFPDMRTAFHNNYILGPDQLACLGLVGQLYASNRVADAIWTKEAKVRNL